MRGEHALNNLFKVTKPFVKRNLPTILTTVGAIGVVTTGVTSATATPKAIKLLQQAEEKKGKKLTTLEKVKVASPVYIPSVIIGTATIVCVFGSNAINKHRQEALISAYAVLEIGRASCRERVSSPV